MASRLRRLGDEGHLRPGLARRRRLMDLLLHLQRRRLMTIVPPRGFSPEPEGGPAMRSLPLHPRLREWIEGALGDEARMAELLS
jgi:hypothetical protein